MSKSDFVNIKIKNANNINEWNIWIVKNCLNIKYGINWTWKSTISNAIWYYFNDKENIKRLTPYQNRNKEQETLPEIVWLDDFTNVSIFNEDYIKNTVCKENEIIKWSFKVFIQDKDYDERMKEIEVLIKKLKEFFEENETINDLIITLEDLTKQAKTTSSWGMHSWSAFIKAFENWNLIENIPSNLINYSTFIKDKERVSWITWQKQWEKFLDLDNNCPCCANSINENEKENIKSVSVHYNKTNISHLDKIIKNFENIKDYFTDEEWKKIENIIKKWESFTEQEKWYIISIKEESEKLVWYLKDIKWISFFSLKDEKEIKNKIESYKINKDYLNYFKWKDFEEKVDEINEYLDKLIEDIWKLQWKINNHKTCIKWKIDKSINSINEFLNKWWYNYIIDSFEEWESFKLILKPKDWDFLIDENNNGLSFGEKNAFSIIMFMFQTLVNKSDLIILDDPISSFDNNKKFAILDMLFSNQVWKENFFKKTVLMLTHDFEPVIDIIYNNLPKCLKEHSNANFISNNNWELTEKEIKKDDIKLFTNLLESKLKDSNTNNINKLVYLRRLFELQNKKGLEYNLLSSLVHKKDKPDRKNKEYDKNNSDSEEYVDLTEEEILEVSKSFKDYITDFDYNIYLDKLNNDEKMLELYNNTNSNFEKLQLFRIIAWENKNINSVISKFINETFHIENDYLFQLDPIEYELVPKYITNECDKEVKKLN